jgi:xylulokinase
MTAKILTIDLGTTFFKFAVFDRDGRLCHSVAIAPPIVRPEADRMELPANAMEQTIVGGIRALEAHCGRLTDVEAVAFATQTNSFLLLDDGSRPLTPLILWPDERAAHFEAELRRWWQSVPAAGATGVPQLNRQFMAAKLLWLRRHCTDLWRRMSRVALVSDYLTLLMTGQLATEAGAAGLTGLVDIRTRRWSDELLAHFGLSECNLPTIVRAGTDLGPILPAAAERFGLPASCRFVVGCLDQYAGAIGVGNVAPGTISETTGTVLATVCCADRFCEHNQDRSERDSPIFADGKIRTVPVPAVFQGPAFREGLFWRMAFGDISANYLHWYRDQLPDRPEFEQLTAAAEAIEPGAGGLRLRADAALTSIENVFDGLTDRCGRGYIVRCILEAVAAALADQVMALGQRVPPAAIRCAGGAARSDLWLQIKADVLGTATVAVECDEPTSLGAAMLAEAALRASPESLPSPFGRGAGGEGRVVAHPQDRDLPASALTLTLSQRERGPISGQTLTVSQRERGPISGQTLSGQARSGVALDQLARQWVRPKPSHRPDPTRHRLYQSLRISSIDSLSPF